MNEVTREVAEADIQKWVEAKRFSKKKLDTAKENLEVLIDAVEEGILIVNEDFSFVQKLKFPFGQEIKIDALAYKFRIPAGEVLSQLKGVKASDGDTRILAYGAALTGKPKEVLSKMDTEDYALMQNIALFFL